MIFTKRTLLLHLFLVGVAALNTAWAQTLVGTWQGSIEIPGQPLEIGLTFTGDGDGVSGTIDIPVQGVADLPLKDVTQQARQVSFALTPVPAAAQRAGGRRDGVDLDRRAQRPRARGLHPAAARG